MNQMNRILVVTIVLLVVVITHAQPPVLQSAINYHRYGELDKALEAIERAAQHPRTINDAKTWYYRGEIFWSIANSRDEKYKSLSASPLEEAYTSFSRTLELDKRGEFKRETIANLNKLMIAFYNKGREYYSNEQFDKAHQAFSYALKIAPNNSGVIFATALSADKTGKIEEASHLYESLLKEDTIDIDVYIAYTRMYKRLKQFDRAMEIIKRAIVKFPQNRDMLIEELDIFLQAGRIGEKLDDLEKAIALDPENAALYRLKGNAYQNLSDSLDKQGKTNLDYLKIAEQAYLKALELETNDFHANFNLGILYYNQAVKVVEHMKKLSIRQQKEYEQLKQQRDNFFNKALPYLERAHALNEKDAPTVVALNKIYTILQKQDKAEEYQKKLEALSGN